MNLRTIALAFLVAILVAACGSPSSDPFVGTYVLDVDRTLAASGGEAGKPTEATLQAVRADFAPEAYRFDVHRDGTFTLTVGASPTPFVMEGTWRRSGDSVDLATTVVNGMPVGEDAGAIALPCRPEGDVVVLTADGRDLYLRRA